MSRLTTAGLRLLPAEFAHDLTLATLSCGFGRFFLPGNIGNDPLWDFGVDWTTDLAGVGRLKHPIGLAAGMDKNATALGAWQDFGFAFCEVGTLTPRPQVGNPKPRLFRLPGQRAIINRMGFNNDGVTAAVARLRACPIEARGMPVGINLGKNKDTLPAGALEDYRSGFLAAASCGDYFVVNLSSPNTPGLRALATPEFIGELSTLFGSQLQKAWVKLDPDTGRLAFQKNVEAVARSGFGGVILTNTHRVEWPETGGLSGHALLCPANTCLEWAYDVHQGSLGMIGCGGILDGADAVQKIMRGAAAVQLYTALIYRGPWAVWELLREMAAELKLRGFGSVTEAKGAFFKNERI